MTTKRKCPLTGLDAIVDSDESNYDFYKIQLEGIKDCEYLFPGHPTAGLNKNTEEVFSQLIQDDPFKQGKLLRWLYLKTQTSKKQKTPFTIPTICLDLLKDDLAKKKTYKTEITFISEVEDVFEQKITPTQKLDWLLEYIYHDMEDLGQEKTVTNTELFPILATIEPIRVWYLIEALEKEGYLEKKTTRTHTVNMC